MSDQQKRVIILGGGESGVGAALLAKAQGYDVFLSDSGELSDQYSKELNAQEIDFEEGRHTEALILQADEIVKSPGIPNETPILQKIQSENIPIISEIEFAARFTKGKIIAITGSNGKTTTTLLTYHILLSAGLNVQVAGNMGESFARKISQKDSDYWVLEVSSFQLEHCIDFAPDIAMILNITPDHLDRYDQNFQLYTEAKFRIIQNLKKDQHFIYFKDNDTITQEVRRRKITGNVQSVSFEEMQENGAYLAKNNILHFNLKKRKIKFTIDPEMIPLKGKHNMVNTMAAVLASLELGVEESNFREYFSSFEGVPHRLEEVGEINGVKFINDSKATNVDSVYYALDSFDKEIVWIAGGMDKGNDYEKIVPLVNEKVKFLICLGRNNQKLFDTFRDSLRIIYQTDNMRDAVEQALGFAQPGNIILLSPACASFDLFENYEDRGNQYKKVIEKLVKLASLRSK